MSRLRVTAELQLQQSAQQEKIYDCECQISATYIFTGQRCEKAAKGM